MIQLTVCSHQEVPLLSVTVLSENVHCQTRQLLRFTLLPVTTLSYKWMSSQFSLKKTFNGSFTELCQDAAIPLISFSLLHSLIIVLHHHWSRFNDFSLSISLGAARWPAHSSIPRYHHRRSKEVGTEAPICSNSSLGWLSGYVYRDDTNTSQLFCLHPNLLEMCQLQLM